VNKPPVPLGLETFAASILAEARTARWPPVGQFSRSVGRREFVASGHGRGEEEDVGFSVEERAAMKERARELKAPRRGKAGDLEGVLGEDRGDGRRGSGHGREDPRDCYR
jgi:hypothetical protein